MKERNYENLNFRMMSFADFEEFKRACLASDEELTTFLSFGQYMDQYILTDYWNLFNTMLNDRGTNVYGLFEGKTLVGVGTTSPAGRSFGAQVIYWVRNGFHGKGFGVFLMYCLIDRTITHNGSYFAQLVIDRDNIPSVKVAESLGLAKVNEWENFDSGQGKGNSGKFATYFAYVDWLEKMAEENKVQPFHLLQQLWRLEAIGAVETPKMVIREAKPGKTRLSQNLRFIYGRGERPTES